jgi:sirohydrochlorin cobaltochelatase
MKKIKFLMIAMMAFTVCTTFTACGDDKDNDKTPVVIDDNGDNDDEPQTTPSSNYDRYQQAVNTIVNSQKKNDKVILVVAFGSTWEQAYDTFEKVVEDYKSQFSGWDVFLSFSSAICINNARAGENVASRDFYDPEHFLTAIGLAGYKKIIVQSLQVIPGEEFRRVRDTYVKDFMNNRNGDFTDAYMKSLDLNVVVGTPLMAEESDTEALAKVLNEESDIKAAVNEGIVAFMGHGNPEGYDYYGGNIRYLQLEDALRKINNNYYVGTVDMDETYAEDVLEHIAGGTFTYQVGDMTKTITYTANNATKAQLYPLMSIAGDHAHNDMADAEDPESWFSLFNAAGIDTKAYESNFTEACWKNTDEIKANGYIPALAERAKVRALWMQHTKDAIAKLGTDEAMSTPTTAPEE